VCWQSRGNLINGIEKHNGEIATSQAYTQSLLLLDMTVVMAVGSLNEVVD